MTFPLTGTGIWSSELRYGDRNASAKAAGDDALAAFPVPVATDEEATKSRTPATSLMRCRLLLR